jgi:hypothetical protein
MVDAQGRSKGSGFVSFTAAEAGCNAVSQQNIHLLIHSLQVCNSSFDSFVASVPLSPICLHRHHVSDY